MFLIVYAEDLGHPSVKRSAFALSFIDYLLAKPSNYTQCCCVLLSQWVNKSLLKIFKQFMFSSSAVLTIQWVTYVQLFECIKINSFIIKVGDWWVKEFQNNLDENISWYKASSLGFIN